MQGISTTSLLSAEICDESQADCRDPIAGHSQRVWKTIEAGMEDLELVPRHVDSIAVLKSLVTSRCRSCPSESAYFADALEWVNNPGTSTMAACSRECLPAFIATFPAGSIMNQPGPPDRR